MKDILIVDDEVGVKDILSEVLGNAGYNVTDFNDPEKAIKELKSHTYDIVITDLKMPKIDGIQITQAAKKASEDTEVIVITGYASLETAIKALKHKVYDYIFKPFNSTEILMTVNKVYERIELKRKNRELSKNFERALSDMTTLYEISKIINTSEETDEILSFALSTIETSMGLNMVSLMLQDETKGEFHIEKSCGFSKKTVNNFRIKLNDGIIGQAIKPNETVDITGFEKDENFAKNVADSDKKKIDKFVVIPLSAQNHHVGIITIHDLDPNSPKDIEKLKLLEVMSVQIAPMIRLGQYYEERKALLTDSLAGAKNELFLTVQKAGQYRGTLSILIFKLYLTKKANFGIKIFDIGEAVYKSILKHLTPIDSAVKIGLDSFMVILQGKTKILTEEIATKIKASTEKDTIMSKNGILLDYGYADFPMDGQEFEVLVSKAQVSLWKFVKT